MGPYMHRGASADSEDPGTCSTPPSTARPLGAWTAGRGGGECQTGLMIGVQAQGVCTAVLREWGHSRASGDAVSGSGSKNRGNSAAGRTPERVILPPLLHLGIAKQVRESSYPRNRPLHRTVAPKLHRKAFISRGGPTSRSVNPAAKAFAPARIIRPQSRKLAGRTDEVERQQSQHPCRR